MPAGKYRHRITIKNPAADDSRDSSGARVGTGSTVADVWAAREDWSGSETRENGRNVDVVITKFFIRYRTDLHPKMKLFHGVEEFDIESILDFDGTKHELVLQCKKVLP